MRRVELIRPGLTSGTAANAAFDAARCCSGSALPEDGPLRPRWRFSGSRRGQLKVKVTSSTSKAVTPLPAVSLARKLAVAVRSVVAVPVDMLYCRH